MWYLMCCDNDGVAIGYLTKDKSLCTDPDNNMDKLMCFKKKKDASEIILQINLSHSLLPGGYPYRVVPCKV